MGFSPVVIVLMKLRWLRGWIVLVLALIAAVIIVNGIEITETLEALMINNTLGIVNEQIVTRIRALYILNDFPLSVVGM